MALPVLNDKPKYEVVVPSLRKKVKFRPYLVKEEKILLLAMESKDPQQILQSIADTVLACIVDEIDPAKLTTFDIEYLFLKIRSKSVGERAPLVFKCQHCEAENEHTLDVDAITIDVPEKPPSVIQLTDEVSLKMRWPTYYDMAADKGMLEEHDRTQQAFSMLVKCVHSIQTEEANYVLKDEPEQDVMAFFDSLTTEQYRKITEFVESIPAMTHVVEFDCQACGQHNSHHLQGIQDFF